MRRFLILTIVCLLLLIHSTASYAHILVKDGTIGAILHIAPDDDPVAGEQSTFFFELEDTTNKFSLDGCDCMIMIQDREKEIFDYTLPSDNQNTLNSPKVNFTFPNKDLYTIQLMGSPKPGYNFQSFTLKYDVRVEREGKVETKTNNFVKYFAISIIPIAFVIIWLIQKMYKKESFAKIDIKKIIDEDS